MRPPAIEFDEESILDSDGILNLKQIPQSLVVVGAGVIGIEYASMFAAVGTKVTVIDTRRSVVLPEGADVVNTDVWASMGQEEEQFAAVVHPNHPAAATDRHHASGDPEPSMTRRPSRTRRNVSRTNSG